MSLVNYSFAALKDTDPNGLNVVASQAVTVKNDLDGAYSTIYSDSAGVSPITQPGAVTDSNGVLEFWVEAGIYQIESGSRTEIQIIDNDSRLNTLTTTAMAASKHIRLGDKVQTAEFSTGNGGGGVYDVVLTSSVTPNTYNIIAGVADAAISFVLRVGEIVVMDQFGAIGDDDGTGSGTDNSGAMQAALDYFDTSGVVTNDSNKNYHFATGLTIRPKITWDCNQAILAYSGTDTAVTMGDSDNALSYQPEMVRFKLHLIDKTSHGVRLRCTVRAVLHGVIESLYQPFDNTRTNVGVNINAVNASSFWNEISVMVNHTHESFRIKSTGTSYSTDNYLKNCTAFGDHLTDSTSRGITIGVGDTKPEAQGLVISGGNIERCEEGIVVGTFSGPVHMSGIRFESGSNTVDVRFESTAQEANTMIGCANATTVIYDYPASNKTVQFDSKGYLGKTGGRQGHKGGMNLDESGLRDGSGSFNILTEGGASATGSVAHQSGNGSAANGGGWRSYAASHATYAGDMTCFVSGSGVFRVAAGFSEGGNYFRALNGSVTAGADNVSSSGSISYRYTELFSVNATINTSDARLKTDIKPMNTKEIEASKEILKNIGGWKWLAKVEKEGENARVHFGPTVQAVISALKKKKLDPFSYSFVCYDEWDDVYEHKGVVNKDGTQKLDNNGDPIFKAHMTKPAGNLYSLRKAELLMFLISGVGARLEAAGL